MEQNKLLQIIRKDLEELNELTVELTEKEIVSKLEIEIALSKSKLIMQEFELLREQTQEKISLNHIQEEKHKTIKVESNTRIANTQSSNPGDSNNQEDEPSKNPKDEVDLTNSPAETRPDHPKEKEDTLTPTIIPQTDEIDPEPEKEPEADFSKETFGDDMVELEAEQKENDKIANDDGNEAKQEENEPAKIVGEQFIKGKSLNDMMTESQTLDQKFAASSIDKLETAIGLNDRFLYIRELFDDDAALFKQTVIKLDQMNNIKEAVDYLSNNFKWKKNDASLKFVQLIKRRFNS